MNFDVETTQPTWRLWGIEKKDGTVYTIYLKKVRYQNPTKTILLESDDVRSQLEWETIRVKFIKSGTIEKLVNSLVSDDCELESTFVNIFLATYRTFSSPNHVLSLLIERYEFLVKNKKNIQESMNNICKKIISTLHVWLESYPEDFRQPPFYTELRCLYYFTLTYLAKTELHIKTTYKLNTFFKDGNQLDMTTYKSNDFVLNISNCQNSHYNLPNIDEKHFAEQITIMDRDVLKKMVVHQCLGAIWSKNKRSSLAPSVIATIDQFNALSLRVISTVLLEVNSDRPHIIETWINIAQELRVLKNFSSLKAIISGLQSNSVFRLKKAWHSVPQNKVELFQELARIFSEENNQYFQRKLLYEEGTAKYANMFEHNDIHLQKIFKKQHSIRKKLNVGTIPYLGTFLTDLNMIDTATPDFLSDGLINFDKKRKEFEILAQIKLLQSAANSYSFNEDLAFKQWFYSILVLDDREAFRISCQIEPETEKKHMDSSNYNNKSYYEFTEDGLESSNSFLNKNNYLLDRSSILNYSLQSYNISLNGSNNRNVSNKNNSNTSNNLNHSSDFYIIRVSLDNDNSDIDGIVLYKSIILNNNERTPQVIRNAMLKFCIDDDPNNYTLSQMLPDKEMVLPTNANVYYAVNTAFKLDFLLRKKF